MQLILHDAGAALAVSSVSDAGIRIADRVYRQSLLLSAERVEHPWAVTSPTQLDAEVAQRLLAWNPEIVIVGSGRRLIFPQPEFAAALMGAGVGCEAMDNHAACRTYNVLVSEGRKVLAALIQ